MSGEMEEVTGPISDSSGEAVENPQDEADILADQDQASSDGSNSTDSDDKRMGGMGSDDIVTGPDEFVRGEVDVAEQMSRSMAEMDHVTGRDRREQKHLPDSPG